MSDAADTCPRCGRAFQCGMNNATPCACTTLRLSTELLATLRERYTGCLCLACLAELAAAPMNTAPMNTGPVLH